MNKSVLVIALGFVLTSVALGQTNRGGISGTVFDQSGAVVSGATVIITNMGTNETQRVTTSDSGTYNVQNLDPVLYKVEVQASGFDKSVVDKVKINTATVETVNVTLKPGNIQTQVQVTARPPLIARESGTLGQTITERMLTDIPLANRSVLDLAVLAPNVSGDVGSEDPGVTAGATAPGFNLSVNGGRPGTTTMLADGVSNTGVGLAREVVAFSPETVQEFTVQTSAYSAQFGQTGGGVISVTTKSGTNQLHGGAVWYHRNPATNAAPFTLATKNRPTDPLRYNQASFYVGGPVVIPKVYNGRDRTFFFAALEPRWRRDTLQEDTLLPTDAMRNGDFSNLTAVNGGWAPTSVVSQFQSTLPAGVTLANGNSSTIYQQYNLVNGNQLQALPTPGSGKTFVPFANNTIPQNMLDPVSQKLLKYMPEPQAYYIDGNGNLVDYTLQRFVQQNERRYTLRLDQVITDRNHASFRFTDVPAVGITGFGSTVNGNGASYSTSHQYVISDTQTITPSIFNDLRLNYTYGRFSGTFSPQYDIKTGQNLSTQLGLPSLTKGGLPGITFDTLNAFAGIAGEGSTLNDNDEEQYQIADNLYISHGKMTWTTGVLLAKDALNVTNYFGAAGGRYDFRFVQTDSNGTSRTDGNSFASFLLGVPNDVLLADTVIPYHYRWESLGAFVQNDWKVRPNLTLNLGLRYSLQLPRTETNNLQGVFLPSMAQTIPLPNPITLPGIGTLPVTSVTVPPFAFSGMGGRSAHLTPVNYMDFEPRFGFAYSPHWFGWNNFVVRGGYGLSHVPLTGQNRQPNPNFGGTNLTFNPTTGQTDPNFIMRLCCNPPFDPPLTPQEAVNAPSNGLEYLPGINVGGFILSPNSSTPYVQNWNISFSRQFRANTVLEVAYVGAKGTHLFLPAINENQFNPSFVQSLEAANLNPTNSTIPDPLGRTGPQKCTTTSSGLVCKPGPVLRVADGFLESPYLGYGSLSTLYDASANSIRHAAYISLTHRESGGLTLQTSYTFGKSIDDASNSSPDKNVLTSSNLPGGQITYGGTAKGDRSVSTFDIKHQINAIAIYDLPFGRGRRFMSHAWKPVEGAVGGWSVSGVERLYTGFPAVVTTAFGNYLGTITHDIRPNIVSGVPVVNPLWNRNCPLGNTCQPYINPAAFEIPPAGQLGNAPRTLDMARGPWQQTLDMSLQKNFQISERFRLQFRVDAINVLNHPIFRAVPNNFGGTDIFGGDVNPGNISTSEYNAWANFNNQPLVNSKGQGAGAALYAQVNQNLTNARLPSGALPANFFTVPVPQGFALTNANSYDITNLPGLKLFRLRQNEGNGAGSLYNPGGSQRYIQFALRIFF